MAESPVAFECCVTQIVALRSTARTTAGDWLVLGEVVGVHIAHHLLRDGVYDTAGARPMLRGGYSDGVRPVARWNRRREDAASW